MSGRSDGWWGGWRGWTGGEWAASHLLPQGPQLGPQVGTLLLVGLGLSQPLPSGPQLSPQLARLPLQPSVVLLEGLALRLSCLPQLQRLASSTPLLQGEGENGGREERKREGREGGREDGGRERYNMLSLTASTSGADSF